MAETVRVSTLRENLAECPICTEEFDYGSKIPRRMPCCGQPIGQDCLEKYAKGRNNIPCPLCKVSVNISDGVRSLPKDMTVLRFLDLLKTQKDAVPMCTDCPDHNKAMAKCDECGIYLCEPCLKAHARNRTTRNHRTSTFEDIKCWPRRSVKKGTASGDSSKLKEKLDKITQRVKNLFDIEENINKSQKRATEQINKRFDDMMEELQHRRGILLSQVEAKADKERKSISRALESHKTLQDKLKSVSRSGHSATSLLKETPEDVDAERIGVTFTEANMQQLLTTIRSAGQVRLVIFTPTQRPDAVPEDELYNAVKFNPNDFHEVIDTGMRISTACKDIISPLLEFDHNTASADVQISAGILSNIQRDPAPRDTGCRLRSQRRGLTLRPLLLRRGQVAVIFTRVVVTVKKKRREDGMFWEVSITETPVDADWNQHNGFCIGVFKQGSQLCLRAKYDAKTLINVPFTRYHDGTSFDLHLCIMMDRDANTIHVVDVNKVEVVATIEASLDRPLWVLMYVADPFYTEMKSELISGRVPLTPEIKQLLYSLI